MRTANLRYMEETKMFRPMRRASRAIPESTLTAQADYVLRNDSSLAHLQAAAEQLCTKLLAEGGAGKEL